MTSIPLKPAAAAFAAFVVSAAPAAADCFAEDLLGKRTEWNFHSDRLYPDEPIGNVIKRVWDQKCLPQIQKHWDQTLAAAGTAMHFRDLGSLKGGMECKNSETGAKICDIEVRGSLVDGDVVKVDTVKYTVDLNQIRIIFIS